MSVRPLLLALGLTLGDYLLWTWSLNNSQDVIALVAGVTLPPLILACIWLAAVYVLRLIGGRGGLISRRTARRTLGPGLHEHAAAQPAGAAVAEGGPDADSDQRPHRLAA